MARKSKPMIQIVAGISLNGKLADEEGDFTKYSSAEDQDYLRKKIHESDVLVMGRKTFDQYAKKKGRPVIVLTRKKPPLKAISFDKRLIHYWHGMKNDFLKLLKQYDYRVVTVLGGAQTYHWFIKSGLPTDIFIIVEPWIIGRGKDFLDDSEFIQMQTWKLKSCKQLNEKGTILLHYIP